MELNNNLVMIVLLLAIVTKGISNYSLLRRFLLNNYLLFILYMTVGCVCVCMFCYCLILVITVIDIDIHTIKQNYTSLFHNESIIEYYQ